MTFRFPLQIPRAVLSLKQARSPDRLVRNLCQVDGFKFNIPARNGEQISGLHQTKILDDCKKCFKISVQEQLSYLSFNKNTKPFSARSKCRKNTRNINKIPHIDLVQQKQIDNDCEYMCAKIGKSRQRKHKNGIVGQGMNQRSLLNIPDRASYNQKVSYNTKAWMPPCKESEKTQVKMRKEFECKEDIEVEQEQKLFFRNVSRPLPDDCVPCQRYLTPQRAPKLEKPTKYFNDEEMKYCLQDQLRMCDTQERADDVLGYKIVPKKLSKIPNTDDCSVCERMKSLVTRSPKIKPLKKMYDDTKLNFAHPPNCLVPCRMDRADDLAGYKSIPKKLSKLRFSEDCKECRRHDFGVKTSKLKSPLKYYDDSKLPFNHQCLETSEEIKRSDDVFGYKVAPKKLPNLFEERIGCERVDSLALESPKMRLLKKSYEDSRLPYNHKHTDNCEVAERSDDLAGYKVVQKVLSSIPITNDCRQCTRLDHLVTKPATLRRPKKLYDDTKLPFHDPQCESISDIPRLDDVMGYNIVRKKLSKLRISDECIQCERLDPLVSITPKLNRPKKLYDDTKMAFNHNDYSKTHGSVVHPRCDDEIQNITAPKQLKKLLTSDDPIPCDRYCPYRDIIASKLKPPKRREENEISCKNDKISKEICGNIYNVDPPRMDDVMCWRPKRRKLPSLKINHLKYSTYSSIGIPSKLNDLLGIKSKKRNLPLFNTNQSHRYSTSAPNDMRLNSIIIENLFKNDFDNEAGSFLNNIQFSKLFESNTIQECKPYLTECSLELSEDLISVKPPLPTWGYIDISNKDVFQSNDIKNTQNDTALCSFEQSNQDQSNDRKLSILEPDEGNFAHKLINPLSGWGYLSPPEVQTYLDGASLQKEELDNIFSQKFRTYSTQSCINEHQTATKKRAPYLCYSDCKEKYIKDPTECPDLFLRLLQPRYQFHDPIHLVKPPLPAWGHLDPSMEEKCRMGYKSNGPLYDGPWNEHEAIRNLCPKIHAEGCDPRAPESCCADRPNLTCNKIFAPYPSFSDLKPTFPEVEHNECWYKNMMTKKQKVELNFTKAKKLISRMFATKATRSRGTSKIKTKKYTSNACKKSKNPEPKERISPDENHNDYICTPSCCFVEDDNIQRECAAPIHRPSKQSLFCKGSTSNLDMKHHNCGHKEMHTSKVPTFRTPLKINSQFRYKSSKEPKSCCVPKIKSSSDKSDSKPQSCECKSKLDQKNPEESKPKKTFSCMTPSVEVKKENTNVCMRTDKPDKATKFASMTSIKKSISQKFKSKTKALRNKSKKRTPKPCCPASATKGTAVTREMFRCGTPSGHKKKCGKASECCKKQTLVCGKCHSKPRPTFLEKICAYFRARPNCPEPDDWKKKQIKEKAIQAAKAAGLEICERSDKLCGKVKKQPPPPPTSKQFSTFSHINSRRLSTFINNTPSKNNILPNLSTKHIAQVGSLSNKNMYVGRMYQVKLSKIGVKNGLVHRKADEEPYTICQICKFVPKTSTPTLHKSKEKRKCS